MTEEFPVVYHYRQDDVSTQISGGPDRIVTDKPDPDFKPRPVGFTQGEK